MSWPVAAVSVACFTAVLIAAMIKCDRIPWILELFLD